MFLSNYISEFYFEELLDSYEEEYLNDLDEENFVKVYSLFRNLGFYFIEDIILKYLEIFYMEYDEVKVKLEELRDKLGENYISIIGSNMTYLNEIID